MNLTTVVQRQPATQAKVNLYDIPWATELVQDGLIITPLNNHESETLSPSS